MKKLYILFILLLFVSTNIFSQDRYWVNSSGSWSDTNHWSDVSGGQSGFSIPTIETDVYFDGNSFSGEENNVSIEHIQYSKSVSSSVNFTLNSIYSNDTLLLESQLPTNVSVNHVNIEVIESQTKSDHYSISATSTNVSCYGVCDGTITISIESGTPIYPVELTLYVPSDAGGGTIVVSGLNSGDFPYIYNNLCATGSNYTVKAQDQISGSSGRAWASNIILTGPGELIIGDEDVNDPSCFGAGDGNIEIIFVQNAYYPIANYNWSNGAGNVDNNINLNGGSFGVIVTDAHGCTGTFNWILSEPPKINIDDSTYSAHICGGGTNGFIHINASGGTGTLTYDIGGGTPTNTDGNFTNLPSGNYTITITDDNGCSITSGVYNLLDNTIITVTDVSINPLCNGDANGEINITAQNGTGPYTYSWTTVDGLIPTGQELNEDLTGLIAGTYDVVVTDNVGCSTTYSVTLTDNGILTLTEDNIQNISCNGLTDGVIDITIVGGAGGFLYNWTESAGGSGVINGQEDQSGLSAGTYQVTVTDGNACTVDSIWNLTEPTAVTITEDDVQQVQCNGNNDAYIHIITTGGTGVGTYTFAWSTVGGSGLTAGQESQDNLTDGSYTITVTDGNNCTKTQTWTIIEPTVLTLSETHLHPTCNNNNNGSIDLTVSGGTLNYSYFWTTVDGTIPAGEEVQQDPSGLTAGTYDVLVTDGNGCTEALSIVLSDPNAILLSEIHNDISCNGYNDGDIDLTTGGGTFPYVWSWEDGAGNVFATTEDISGLAPDTYCVTVTDFGPCTETLCVTIIDPAGMTITTNSTGSPLCNGGNDGFILISLSGGTGTYTYNWQTLDGSGIVVGVDNQTTLTSGTYNLTVTDGNGCQKTESWLIADPALLVVTEAHIDPSCNTGANGSIDLTVLGGTVAGAYNYNWATDDGSGIVAGAEDQTTLTGGTYNVTVSDDNGCLQILSILLDDPNAILISEIVTDVDCNGANTGAIDLSTNGGTPQYTWDWENQANLGVSIGTTEDISGLVAGTYCVDVLDNGPCPASKCITINEPSEIIITTDNTTDVTCNGGNDGVINISVNGGVGTYTYTWQTPDGSGIVAGAEDQTTLTAGTYILIVSDGSGCDKTDSWTITEPIPVVITTVNTVNPTCNGNNDGAINITISDGIAPYTFNWATADGSGIVAGAENQLTLTGGTYNLIVTDANGCSQTDSWTIVEPTPVAISLDNIVDVTCNGGNDGGINISVSGGTVAAVYSYNWEDNANPGTSISTSEDLSGVSAGTYNVTATDDNGCTSNGSWTINEPAPITFTTETSNNITCFGETDGTIYVVAANGAVPYSYNIGTGAQATGSFTNLGTGTYTVIVTDNNGCTVESGPYTITEPNSLQAHFYNVAQNICDASCNGQATLSIEGGTIAAGYTYTWNPNPATITQDTILSDLCPNTYNVTVTDDNGCFDTSSVTIIEIIPISIIEENLVNITCNSACTGEVEIAVTASNPPYTIAWDNGDLDTLAQNLCAGIHTVTITDVNSCQKDTSFTIVEPIAITYTFELVHNRCFGYSNGQVTIHASGGTPPYSFDFGAGFTTDSVNSNLAAGTYNVTITDANSCNIPATNYTIQEPSSFTTNTVLNSQPSCANICDGDAITTPNGGVTPYAYSWTSAETSDNAVALCDGWNYVTITDDSLCIITDSVQMIAPLPITASYDTTQIRCSGDCTGDITANVSGGTLPYTYAWEGGGSSVVLPNLCAGDYQLTVTDGNGCQFIDTIEIVEPTPIVLAFNSISNVSCYSLCDGSATAVGNGGSGTYTYVWANTENTVTASALCAGWTALTITDDSLCSVVDSVNIIQPDSIEYTIETTNPSCNGDCDGNVIIHVTGGSTPYSFDWGLGATPNDSILSNQCAGNYTVAISDANGCTAPVASATINEYPVLTANITDSTMLNCYNECIGTATVLAGGGTGIYNYSWSNNDDTTIADSLCAQTYFVTVSDNNSCTAVDSVIITQPDSIQISFINITQVDCGGGCTGEATIDVIGGTPAYTYVWPDGQSTPTLDILCADLYEVTVTDINLCSNTASIEIVDTSDLVISAAVINHITCNGLCDGTAFASSTGGYPPYNYTWNTTPVQANDTAFNLCANTYQVTVVDDSLCSRVAQVVINESEMLVVNENSTNPTCNGNCDGEAWINITGGANPYTTSWETSSTDTIISNLCEDWYSYSVIDANNCQVNDSIQIITPSVISLDITDSLNINCFGDSTGWAIVTAYGGAIPYSYVWSSGATNTTANNLWAGTHFVTVQDLNGCSAIDSVTLTQGDSLYVDFVNIINPHCGGCNGEIMAVGGGGVAAYNYQWGASALNSTDSAITNLCVNVYNITVTDANLCTVSNNYILNDTSSIAVNVIDSTMATCSYSCDGAAAVEGINGIAPYSYSWSTGDMDSTIDNQCVGYYYVTIQDQQNCQNIDSVHISGPDELIITIDTIRPLGCAGDCNGEITVAVTGGTPSYTYLWSTTGTDSTITNLCQGAYSLTVTDTHNCIDSLDTVLTAPNPILLAFEDTIPLCNNGSGDGAIYLDVQGGVPGYTYLWSNTDTTQNIVGIDGGWYFVSVTDTVGCQVSDSTFLGASITVTSHADSTTILCAKDSVQLYGTAVISDGAGYNFVWHPGVNMIDSNAQNPIVFVDSTTVFYFEVLHNNGICYDIDSVTVYTYPSINIDAGEDVTILHDQSTTLVSTGGDGSTLYLWIPDTYLETPTDYYTVATPEETTMYYIIATSQHGCVYTDSVMVNVIPELIIPNGITPNGDGINDVWILDYVFLFPNIEVEVFNRWGEQMFYSKGYPDSERWDGNYKGKPLPTGTYYYIIKLNDGIHNEPFTGPITIVR